MKWTPRQLMLPVIVGISLTGVSLGILYLIAEKEKRDKQSGKATEARRQGTMTLELQIPKEFVPAIIGRGGSMVKTLESSTDTKIHFEKEDSEAPYRICFVKGKSAEGLRMADAMIKNIIGSQPLVETYETFVPQRVCPQLIGRAGETIKQIQSSTKAKVIIEKTWSYDPNSKTRIIIKGTAEQIAAALTQIEDKVHEYMETLEKLAASETSRSPRGKVSPRISAVSPSADNQLVAQPSDEHALHEGSMEVYVSAIENPSQFWVQVAGKGIFSLDELVAEMTAYYEIQENRELHALKNVTVGQTVAAKFMFDGKWYRAEVISFTEDTEAEVYFLDYGDHETVSLKDVLELRTDFLSLRLQAIECSLASVKPRDGEWSPEACDRFGELAWVSQWKVLIAKVRGYKERALGHGRSRREGSPIPCVDLYDKTDNQDINIGKVLVAENLAEAEEGAWSAASSTLSLSRRSNDNPASPTPVRSPPPTARPLKKATIVEEIDLTTPQKSSARVEEIDLVTPVKSARQLIDLEKRESSESGGGEANRTPNGNHNTAQPSNGDSKSFATPKMNIMPAGYEDDDSEDSDEYTIG